LPNPTILTLGECGKEQVISSDKGKKLDFKSEDNKETVSLDEYVEIVR